MADDDLETGRPREAGRIPFGRSPLGFSQALTLFLTLLLVGLLVCTTVPGSESVRLYAMERPIDTTQRVLERNLWVEDAVAELPEWSQTIAHSLLSTSATPREDAIDAFDEALRKNGYARGDMPGESRDPDPLALDGLRARRAVLLAEVGRVDDAAGDLQRLETTGHASFVAALRRAYSNVRTDDARTFASYDRNLVGDDWIGVHFAQRLADRVGDAAETARWNGVVRERTAHFAQRVRWITIANGVLVALGLVVVLVWLGRNRPELRASTAEIPPAWTFESGYSACVRIAFVGILVSLMLMQANAWTGLGFFDVWGWLLVGLPMAWIVRGRLLRPLGTTFGAAFGLRVTSGAVSWIGFTLALFALSRLGSRAILDVVHALGMSTHWAQGIDANMIWDQGPSAWLRLVDTCVWAPIVVELGFRGVFYATLRRHYSPWRAALLSSVLFAAVFPSAPEFLSVTWEGFLLAIAFERCRTIVPGILCGILGSALASGTSWLLLR